MSPFGDEWMIMGRRDRNKARVLEDLGLSFFVSFRQVCMKNGEKGPKV